MFQGNVCTPSSSKKLRFSNIIPYYIFDELELNPFTIFQQLILAEVNFFREILLCYGELLLKNSALRSDFSCFSVYFEVIIVITLI